MIKRSFVLVLQRNWQSKTTCTSSRKRRLRRSASKLCSQGRTWADVGHRYCPRRRGGREQGWTASARPLTAKELLIVALVVQGYKNKEIAAELGTTEQVIKNYLRKVYDKIGVSDRLEVALFMIRHRVFSQESVGAAVSSRTFESAPV